MRYLSAALVWIVTMWMDVTVMRLQGDTEGDQAVAMFLTIVSIIFTLCILFHGAKKA